MLVAIITLSICACSGGSHVTAPTENTSSQVNEGISSTTGEYKRNADGYYALSKEQFVAMCRTIEINKDNWKEYFGDSEPVAATDNDGKEYIAHGYGRLPFPHNTIALDFGDPHVLKLSNVKLYRKWFSDEYDLVDLTLKDRVINSTWTDGAYASLDDDNPFYSISDAEFVSSDIVFLVIDIPEELWTADGSGNRHLMVENFFDLGNDEAISNGILGLFVNDFWEYIEKGNNPLHTYYKIKYPN